MRWPNDIERVGGARWDLLRSEALAVLACFPDNSVDSWITDPPAGIGFMGKKWDKFGETRGMKPETIAAQKAAEKRNEPFGRSGVPAKPAKGARAAFVRFITEIAAEVHRVLKPGAHGLVWALPRTAHWTAWALEDAGFEIRDTLAHFFGSGFIKSHNVAKAIQKKQGVQPIGEKPPTLGMAHNPQWNDLKRQLIMPDPEGDAADWDGFGTALKPAREDWIFVRKSPEGSIAANVLKWGTGAINIKACLVNGKRPAHITFDEEAAEELGRQHKKAPSFFYVAKPCRREKETGCDELTARTAAELTGRKEGSEGLVMRHADGRDKANPYAGTSGAQPRKNHHPTVKPVSLMRYYIRLITPPGGLVLDTFAGSGTTGVAALAEGCRFIGVEKDEDEPGKRAGYYDIAKARLMHAAPAVSAVDHALEGF